MARTVPAYVAAVLCSVIPVIAAAQTPPLPPGVPQPLRDTSATGAATAVIRGHVFDASTGAPLRKAQVRAFSPELRENRLAITDNGGAYEIKALAAGRYQLSANKGSFVGLNYGQTRPFEQGRPLELHEAQALEKVDFRLPRGSVVTGGVVDETGEAVTDVLVSVLRYQYIGGRRQLSPAGRPAQTNDIGEFRVFGLPPGQYFVSATLRGVGNPNDAQSDNRSGYAPTYFPSTPSLADAQRITVGIAQTLSDINIALSPTRLARLAGTVVDSDGKPLANGIITMMQATGGMVMSIMGAQIKPDGSFSIANVAPGEYTLRALVSNGPFGGASTDFIQANVTVAGDDVLDLRLTGVKPSTVSGRVIPPPSQSGSFAFASLQLSATSATPMPLSGTALGHVNDDGTFEMKVQPGRAFIRMNAVGPFANTRIASVRVNGVETIDSGIDFRPNEDLGGVEVELTTQLSSVSGIVTDDRGNAVKDYSVVIFARDREHWGFGSRYLNGGRPDQDGRYKAVNLPPGDYFAVALDYVEQGAGTDPEFLDRVKDRATTFSIGEAETKNLDLKLVTGL